MVVFTEHPAGLRLLVRKRSRDVVDGRAGNAGRGERLDPVGDSASRKNGFELCGERVPVAAAGREVGEALVVGEDGLLESSAELAPEGLFCDGNDEKPSAAGNIWNGITVWWDESGMRCATQSREAVHVPMYVSSARAVSNSDRSTSQPTPSRRARQTPARRPIAATYPAEKSTSESPLFVGGSSGPPVTLIHPASACIVAS